MDRLAGHFSVDASARLVRHYRYAEVRLMRMLGGWIALTPELGAKLLFGRHVWDCAQHADLWGRRLPELRAPAQQSEPPGEAFVRFLDRIEAREAREDTPERLVGVYRVLKPHLAAVYDRHLARSNVVYEPPTRRILERCLDEERRHVAAGAAVFEPLVAGTALARRAEAWERALLDELAQSGGASGEGEGTEPRELVIAPHAETARDLVPTPSGRRWASDPEALPPDLVAALAAHAALSPALVEAAVVAVAKVGAHRLVKLRVEAKASAGVVQLLCRRGERGWSVAAPAEAPGS